MLMKPSNECVCVFGRRPPSRYITGSKTKRWIYIYNIWWKNIHSHIWPSCACFRLPLPTSFRLSLPRLGQETSDVAEIDNPGAEKAGKVLLVFFLWFSWKMHFCKYAHRCGQWAHMQETQEVTVIFDFWPWNLECGWNAVGMRCLPAFCLNRACFPHLKRNFVLF